MTPEDFDYYFSMWLRNWNGAITGTSVLTFCVVMSFMLRSWMRRG
ncbi:hypothetical protein [Rathayibacter festucae]|nr:hypothetical protein [Rathayibacter festucae]